MPGLERTQEENERLEGIVKLIIPTLDLSKVQINYDGQSMYTLKRLSDDERIELKKAGYRSNGRWWVRNNKPELSLVEK